jgi:large repetitive protein
MKHAAFLISMLLLAVLIGGCSHEIESPQPSGSRAEPDLVCNAAPVGRDYSNFVLHGDGFTPMPTKTLEGDDSAVLVLPTIELNQKLDIAGVPNETSHLAFGGSPDQAFASRVHWYSEQKMSVDVLPDDQVPTGVYSITVRNPDGKADVTLDKGLAVLPPPMISELRPPAICDDQSDQTIEIVGENFLKLGDVLPSVTVGENTYTPTSASDCTQVVGNFAEPSVELCKSLTIVIPQGDFVVDEATSFPVVVTNPPPADCASSSEVSLLIQPPPRVDEVIPSTVCEGGSTVTIHGANFQDGATVELICPGVDSLTAISADASDDGSILTAIFGTGATVGDSCEIVVTNPDGCEDRPLPHQIVTVVSGPILFFVDPPVVYNGVSTRITLFATTITPPLADDAVTIVPAGETAPVTILEHQAVPNHPNRLQALVPEGLDPGTYDVRLADDSGCNSTLPNGLIVTDALTVTIASVKPSFGWTERDTAITIFRDPGGAAFQATPRVFLNPASPQPDDIAVEVVSVAWVDDNTATGVVPAGTPVNEYDLILVNPDGTVGVLAAGFTEVQDAPPVITSATPASIVAATDQNVVLGGTNFDAGATASLTCVASDGSPVAAPPVTNTAPTCDANQRCTMDMTIDGSGLSAGDVCVVTVTNPDGSYGEFSAIGVTTPSLNLNDPAVGTDMNVGRRAVSSAAGKATPAARFVYALGGDDGQASGALDSTEFAPVDLFGKMGAWTMQGATLHAPRTLAGAATVGRYTYLVGGDDGNGPVATAERALILSPRETPDIADVDLALGDVGLDPGEWHYRVSAVMDAADTDNPGGETLASDPFSLKLPDISGKRISVTLVWSAPLDALGDPLLGVAGYRIYRTPAADSPPGSEVLIGTVDDPATLTFQDDGSAVPGTETPLPLGSTGKWLALADMATARSGLAVATGFDPADPAVFYVYAMLGKTNATTATGSYEYLSVAIADNGRQLVSSSWQAGAQSSPEPRWLAGAWTADNVVSSLISTPDTFIYLGGGRLGDDTAANRVEAGKIVAGGDLGAFDDAPRDFSSNVAGYGVTAANGQLFVFGGGPNPINGAKSAELVAPPPALANNSWNNEGLQMTEARFLLGSSVQSAFIFLVGGQTANEAATRSTELVVW